MEHEGQEVRVWFALGCISAAFSVIFGAFGAHYLKSHYPLDQLVIFETAVRYQMYHSFALIAVAFAASKFENRAINFAGYSFVIGILLFSGSLYALVFSQIKILGAITPLGGLALIFGWAMLVRSSLVSKTS